MEGKTEGGRLRNPNILQNNTSLSKAICGRRKIRLDLDDTPSHSQVKKSQI